MAIEGVYRDIGLKADFLVIFGGRFLPFAPFSSLFFHFASSFPIYSGFSYFDQNRKFYTPPKFVMKISESHF